MRPVLFGLVFLVSTLSYAQNLRLQEETLLETDRQLAVRAEVIGFHKALAEFADDECILLPRLGYPINGKGNFEKAASQVLSESKDNAPAWKPILAGISRSNDLGYTFGRYPLQVPDSDKYEDVQYNYYSSVWKRQDNGSWKIAAHAGLLDIPTESADEKPFYSVTGFSPSEKEILKADSDFSKLSSQQGYFKSFLAYIADDGLAFSGGGQPPSNKERFRQLVEMQGDKPSSFQLTWKPVFASMAQSGELGFTHGKYQSIASDKDGKQIRGCGYYISIWKTESDGSWKFILDGGNQCPPVEDSK